MSAREKRSPGETLPALIDRYIDAQRVWREEVQPEEDKSTTSAAWDAYEQAEAAIMRFSCHSIEDVRLKASFVLSDVNAFDTVRNCVDRTGDEEVPSLRVFLQSLMGDTP